MGSHELQASLGSTIIPWHGLHWAACYRRVRSLQRRIVQAVQAGLAQSQTPELFVSTLVGGARLSHQTSDGERRQEDAGRGGGNRGYPGAKSRSGPTDRTRAELSTPPFETDLHSQTQRPTSPLIGPRLDRPGTSSAPFTSPATPCGNPSRPEFLWLSAQTPRCGRECYV